MCYKVRNMKTGDCAESPSQLAAMLGCLVSQLVVAKGYGGKPVTPSGDLYQIDVTATLREHGWRVCNRYDRIGVDAWPPDSVSIQMKDEDFAANAWNIACNMLHVPPADRDAGPQAKNKRWPAAIARQLAMVLCMDGLQWGKQRTGRAFDRDASCATNARRTVRNISATDKEMAKIEANARRLFASAIYGIV